MPRLQTRLVAAPAASLQRWRRVGDTTSDLNTTGQALLSDLQTNGCKQSRQPTVLAFQTAWNASQALTGVPNNLKVDGFYGVNTENALTSWARGQGIDPTTVPAGCVAAAPSGSAGGSTSTTTTTMNNVTQPVSLALLTASWFGAPAWIWALGGAVLVGIMYETRSRPSFAQTMFKPAKRRSRRMRRVRRRRGRGRRR